MRRDAIPFAGASGLAAFARRTRALRIGAAVALLALAAAAILLGRHPRVREVNFLPAGSNGVVVLDVSASISSDTYSQIGTTLRDLVATRGRYGLVVFSDTAYEALPPGSPSESLRPLVRFFTLPAQRAPGVAPTFPDNPWTRSFSAGTRISAGLDLARSVLIDSHLAHPSVLLVSDLDDDQADLPSLTQALLEYRIEGTPIRVVGLAPDSRNRTLFARLLGSADPITAAPVGDAELDTPPAPYDRSRAPILLAGAAAVLLLLLALNELWLARVVWRSPLEARA